MGEKAKILILGTYHFGYRGEHLIKNKVEDVTKSQKQQEVIELVEALAKFKPNKIAIEARKEREIEINQAYLRYCNDQPLDNDVVNERDEIVQVAFRLGKMLNHTHVYPLDYPVSLPIENMLTYAQDNDTKVYDEFIEKVQNTGKQMKEVINNNTVIDIFRYLNSPEKIKKDHSTFYLHPAQIGAGNNYCGSNVLIEWYKRNIYIFSNLQTISSPDDRILVLYGAEHCKILCDFITDYSDFELVNALDYLSRTKSGENFLK
jgi:hypothetical protein